MSVTLAAECRRVCNPTAGSPALVAAAFSAECVPRIAGLTELGNEHEAGLVPARAGPRTLPGLVGMFAAKQLLGGFGDGHETFGLRRLRLRDKELPVDPRRRPAHPQGALVQ